MTATPGQARDSRECSRRDSLGIESGQERPSQIQIDKPQTPRRERIGDVIGRANDATMNAVNRALTIFLGLV
jgi:mRNA-degrading endonuclease toxin of MazEF toxin-antitoxin module